jgi:hypothetical protein
VTSGFPSGFVGRVSAADKPLCPACGRPITRVAGADEPSVTYCLCERCHQHVMMVVEDDWAVTTPIAREDFHVVLELAERRRAAREQLRQRRRTGVH